MKRKTFWSKLNVLNEKRVWNLFIFWNLTLERLGRRPVGCIKFLLSLRSSFVIYFCLDSALRESNSVGNNRRPWIVWHFYRIRWINFNERWCINVHALSFCNAWNVCEILWKRGNIEIENRFCTNREKFEEKRKFRANFWIFKGRLISLSDDQSFHLWEIDVINNCGDLVLVKECTTAGKWAGLEGLRQKFFIKWLVFRRLKKISCWCLRQDGDACSILIGTESGNVYSLDTITMELTDYIIYQDAVIQKYGSIFFCRIWKKIFAVFQYSRRLQIKPGCRRSFVGSSDGSVEGTKIELSLFGHL